MNRASILLCGLAAAALALAGCASRPVQAPVVERAPPSAKPAARPVAGVAVAPPETYTVRRGDTLISIAMDQGHDYRDLAAWNNLDNPNLIRPGQQLRVKPPPGVQEAPVKVSPVAGASQIESRPLGAQGSARAEPAVRAPAALEAVKSEPLARKLPYSPENVALLQRAEAQAKPSAPEPAPAATVAPKQEPAKTDADVDVEGKIEWSWPAAGSIVAQFSQANNKGIDIGGRLGDPVFASASGVVTYTGAGIPSWGKLIVIRHNKAYLSAYAHNREILVKMNQTVVRGQKIAEIGDLGTDRPKLHFEIRRFGTPVDPARYLPAQ